MRPSASVYLLPLLLVLSCLQCLLQLELLLCQLLDCKFRRPARVQHAGHTILVEGSWPVCHVGHVGQFHCKLSVH